MGEASERRWSWMRRWLPLLVGPIVLVVIYANLDTDRLLETFRRADLLLLIVALLTMIPTIVLKTVRWRLLLHGTAVASARFVELLAIYGYSMFVGVATPGHVGEFVKTFHLTRRGMSLGGAAASVLVDRLFDIAMLLLVSTVSLVVIAVPGLESTPIVVGVVAAVGGLGAVGWKVVASPRLTAALERRAGAGRLGRLLGRLATVHRDFRLAIAGLTPSKVLGSSLLTVATWAITYWANFLLALSLGFDIGYFAIVAVSAITSLISLLPITVLGAGTRDAGMIVLLANYGYSQEHAVALAAFFMGITLVTSLYGALSLFSPAIRFDRRAARGPRDAPR